MSKFGFRISAIIAAVMTANLAVAGNESRSAAYPVASGLIEVVADFSENAIYWCGAGDHALTRMGKPGNQRLYVWQAPSPSRTQPGKIAVTFGLTPPPQGAAPALTTDVRIVGNSLSVSQAKQTCDERTASG